MVPDMILNTFSTLNSFDPHNNPVKYYYLQCTDEETEAQVC